MREDIASTFLGRPAHGEDGSVGFGQILDGKIVLWFFDGYGDEAQEWIELLEGEELATA